MSQVPADLTSSSPAPNRVRSRVIRAIIMFVTVFVAAPATAAGAWMIHQHYLRQKCTREGLPPDAPIDRQLLKMRDQARAPLGGRDYSFMYVARQLESATDSDGTPRTVHPEEWFFYCGPPDLVKRSPDRTEYLYTSREQDIPRVEALLTVGRTSPHVIIRSEVRVLSWQSNNRSSASNLPFSRDGFKPYSLEH